MPSPPSVWARSAFAVGYAEDGEFPVTPRAAAACIAAQESANELDHPAIGPLIVEAGRKEGKRSRRESAYVRLYKRHAKLLIPIIDRILGRLDLDDLAPKVVQAASHQTAGLASVTARRAAVAGVVYGAITAKTHAQDRTDLAAVNASGWASSTAYGVGEAQATPPKGGPPDPAKVAAATAAALKLIPSEAAQQATQAWTDLELRTIAMNAAIAARDGAAVDGAVRAVKAALIDSGRAEAAYADLLHQAVTNAFIAQTQAQTPGVLYDWITQADPCPICEGYAVDGPYLAQDVPDLPAHPNCRCSLEVESTSAAAATASVDG